MYDALAIQLEKQRVPMKSGAGHSFDFGPKELVNMVGLPVSEGNLVLKKLLENKKIQVSADNYFIITDVTEVQKQTEYYRKMQKIERARKESSLQY
jgi:hypothetical protein